MKKSIIFLFSLFFVIVFYSRNNNNLLKITFCDVGQGDATLLSLGQTQVLIDAGPNSKVLECLEHQIPFWDKKIEYFVLTHMDSDHIGGVPLVLDYYDIGFIFVNPSNKKTSDFKLLESAVLREKSSKFKVINTYKGQNIWVRSGFYLTVVSPDINFSQVQQPIFSSTETTLSDINTINLTKKLEKMSENDLSIALKVVFDEVVILLPSDLEAKGELAIMTYGLLNNITAIKAGHHGSKTSSTPGFIDALQPEITVISSGENNRYNHPNPQVIDTYERFGVGIYQTKNSGELVFATDGQKLWEKGKSF